MQIYRHHNGHFLSSVMNGVQDQIPVLEHELRAFKVKHQRSTMTFKVNNRKTHSKIWLNTNHHNTYWTLGIFLTHKFNTYPNHLIIITVPFYQSDVMGNALNIGGFLEKNTSCNRAACRADKNMLTVVSSFDTFRPWQLQKIAIQFNLWSLGSKHFSEVVLTAQGVKANKIESKIRGEASTG